jgi:hypothetical protein
MKKITLFYSTIIVFILLVSISFIQTGFAAQYPIYQHSEDYEIELFDLWNDGTCYSSSYSITNMSSNDPAYITHYFYIADSDTLILTYQDPLPLSPVEIRIYDLAAIPGLPTNYLGYAVVTSDQPISGEVLPFPPCEISLSVYRKTQTIYTFTANIKPEDALLPITYIWIATDNQPVIHTSGISDSVDFIWAKSGWKHISITAENSRGILTIYIWIFIDSFKMFLPITVN